MVTADWTITDGPHIGQNILKSDCILLSEEPGNRIPFSYETWKEKGGRVWYGNKEVDQLTKFKGCGSITYAGVVDGSIMVFRDSELTMSTPDRVVYANVYEDRICSHPSLDECKKYGSINNLGAISILEVNHTQGTNRIVHRYNTEK